MKRIAVVGSGISGLAAAWLLSRRFDVHLFERRRRLGGHTHTVTHELNGTQLDLDTGFVVFNRRTYPQLTLLFELLGVATRPSDMSFGVSCRHPDLEFAVAGVGALFAQPRNVVSWRFLRLVWEIARFGPLARAALAEPRPHETVADFLAQSGLSEDFSRFFLLPMTAAIWSSGTDVSTAFPRDALFRFYANHGLLQITGRPQWYTVRGGSSSYIPRLIEPLGDRVHTDAAVERIVRHESEVEIHTIGGRSDRFDGVVVAAHADQALGMLADPSEAETELLGAWSYSTNDTWLHTDRTLLPRRRRAWASWNYLIEDATALTTDVTVSYHLNRLQNLDTERDFIVTLNPAHEPAPDRVIRRMTYHHPVYTAASVATQADLPSLNGVRRTWFCGAYFRNGFHEDGLQSAITVAADLGVEFP